MPSRTFSALTSILLALVGIGWSSAPVIFEVVDLVPPGVDPATSISAVGVNNAGQVALNAGGHVWLWNGTTDTYIDLGAGAPSRINNAGQIMGALPGSRLAAIWEVGLPPLTYSSAGTFTGFNDVGEISGWIGRYRRVGFYMNHDVQTYIPSFTGDSFGTSVGDAINNLGQVTGMAQNSNNQYNAFIYTAGKLKSLGRFGGDQAEGLAINDKSQVAAASQSWITYINDGYLHDGSKTTRITPLVADDDVWPDGINNNADVIGYSNGVPFVWMNGVTTAVDSLFPAGSGWTSFVIAQINDNRWMTGWGDHNGQSHAFLLRPVGSAGSVPSVTPASPLTLEAGTAAAKVLVATISDPDTLVGNLAVTTPVASAGVTLSNIVNVDGAITADVAIACTTTPGHNVAILKAADPVLVGTGGLFVDVTPNAPPDIGGYAAATIPLAGSVAIAPSVPPADSGGIKSVVATAPGFDGTLSVDQITGTVTVTNARPAGQYIVSVTASDNCDAASTTTFDLNVLPATTSTVLSSSPNPSVNGQPVQFSAVVTVDVGGTPAGSVRFYDGTSSFGTATIVAGQATLTKSNLAVGSHAITAQFIGSSDYITSTSPVITQTVTKKPSSTALSLSASRAVAGELVTMTATVTIVAPGTGAAAGKVKFYDGAALLGSATLSGGVATLPKTFVTGTHLLQARYVGKSTIAPSESPVVRLIVSP